MKYPLTLCSALELEPQSGSVGDEPRALAFMDGKLLYLGFCHSRPRRREPKLISGRRLAKIRLLPDPVLEHKPLSDLGFDPLLSYPDIEDFKALIAKKKGTVKGMIMDQSFSAGVGNVRETVASQMVCADIKLTHPVDRGRVSSSLQILPEMTDRLIPGFYIKRAYIPLAPSHC